MNRRKWGVLILVIGILLTVAVMVALAADKDKGADKGKRAYLGIVPGELTSDIATEYGVASGAGTGIVVEGVSGSSPAGKAGLRENDIILRLNGKALTGPEEFRAQLAKMKAGDDAELVYLRGGKEKTATVKLGEREGFAFDWIPGVHSDDKQIDVKVDPWEWEADRPEHADKNKAFAGIVTQGLSDGLAGYFKVEKGALISEVVKDSPAEKAGLKAGDVIIKIGATAVEDEGDVRKAIREHKPGEATDFVVMREGQQLTIPVTLGEQASRDIHMYQLGHDGDDDGMVILPDGKDFDDLRESLREFRIELKGLSDSASGYIKDIDIDLPKLREDLRNSAPLQDLHKELEKIKIEVHHTFV